MVNNVQPAYQERMDPARAGLIHGSDRDVVTATCETVAGIGFGLAVSQGAASKGAILGGTRLGFLGISVRDVTLKVENADKYLVPNSMGILTRGQIWVAPAVAVVANDPVHFVAATGVLTNTGNQGPINGARWVTAAAGTGDLAIVELSGYKRSA